MIIPICSINIIWMHLISEGHHLNSRGLRRNDETYGIWNIRNQCV
jgi:hypothetical protein